MRCMGQKSSISQMISRPIHRQNKKRIKITMYCDDINLITLYLTYRYVSHGWDFSDFVLCDYGDFSVF